MRLKRSLHAFPRNCLGEDGGMRAPYGPPHNISPLIPPTGDYLTKDAKFVRSAVPRSVRAPRELQKMVLPSYMVQPGDQLLVEPINLDSPLRFPADQTALPDGTIDLGRFGRLIVAGKTIEEIEPDVAAAIQGFEPN